MAKYICEKATECNDETCKDKIPHEHDDWCNSGCDYRYSSFPEAKCKMLNPTGVELIAQERQRQIEQEGWDTKHDDEHPPFSMSTAGACYALDLKASTILCTDHCHKDFTVNDALDCLWPWDGEWWKPTLDDPIRQLVKAGALIAAEIDRLQRMKNKEND